MLCAPWHLILRCALSIEVKIQDARPRGCAFAGMGGVRSILHIVRLAQIRPSRIVQPQLPLLECCQLMQRWNDDGALLRKYPGAGNIGQAVIELRQYL